MMFIKEQRMRTPFTSIQQTYFAYLEDVRTYAFAEFEDFTPRSSPLGPTDPNHQPDLL